MNLPTLTEAMAQSKGVKQSTKEPKPKMTKEKAT